MTERKRDVEKEVEAEDTAPEITCGRRDSFTLKDLKEVSMVVKRV